mgnify:CR=1 FL=1
MNSIFYNVDKKFEIDLLKEAYEKSYEHYFDVLDVSVSFSRQSVNKTFEEMFKIYKNSSFKIFRFIFREDQIMTTKDDYIEVGINADGKDGLSYYMFIHIDVKYLNYFIQKYNLKKI